MKSIFISTLAALVISAPLASAQRFQQEAFLMFSDVKYEKVWVADATKTQFLYFATEQGVDSLKMAVSKPQAIWLVEPPEYTEAMELFQGRKYAEAKDKFGAIREKYMRLRELPDNHSALAAYYQMECFRKLGDLEGLKEAFDKFTPDDRDTLSREHHLRQLELYTLWEAVRVKEWSRLELLGIDRLEIQMPGYQRAQVGYCLGLALEGQKKSIPAINAYNIGMTADTGASERITAESARNALRLYQDDELVKLAIKLHGTPDEEPNSAGALRLKEAAALAALYELTLSGGEPLPASAKGLLKYYEAPDSAPPAPPAPDEDGDK